MTVVLFLPQLCETLSMVLGKLAKYDPSDSVLASLKMFVRCVLAQERVQGGRTLCVSTEESTERTIPYSRVWVSSTPYSSFPLSSFPSHPLPSLLISSLLAFLKSPSVWL